MPRLACCVCHVSVVVQTSTFRDFDMHAVTLELPRQDDGVLKA